MAWTIALALVALVIVLSYSVLVFLSPVLPEATPEELVCRTSRSSDQSQQQQQQQPLPDLTTSSATVELSVIVPAYNERKRIAIMLNETINYLELRKLDESENELPSGVDRGSYEILVVDDGSKDGTADYVLELADDYQRKHKLERGSIKVVTLKRNRGKGGATRHGMLHAAGHRILFCDADGASHFPDLALLQAEMDLVERVQLADKKKSQRVRPDDVHGVIVGSRAHLVRTDAVVKRSFLRNLLMRGFHTYLFVLGIRTIRDTQCGFKLCTRASAAHIWPLMHSSGWIFDCELLILAALAGIPTREVGIQWHEVDGSKVDLVRDSIAMAVDLLVIRANYLLGRWSKPVFIGLETMQQGQRIREQEEQTKKTQ
ncbi:dolichyl-phosphate beta-glucosyltransferase [Microbotryomycetes sp. JL221]|nr:dolichyl-phosphate beta-glucosyltransferase [Microbotryomycetes sp. JL221]